MGQWAGTIGLCGLALLHTSINQVFFFCLDDEAFDAFLEAEAERRREEEEREARAALLNAWQKRGKVRYKHTWRYHSQTHMAKLIWKATAWTGKYTKTVVGDRSSGIVRIGQESKVLANVEEEPPCAYLHLNNQHNALAKELHRYVKVAFGGVFVEVKHSFYQTIS